MGVPQASKMTNDQWLSDSIRGIFLQARKKMHCWGINEPTLWVHKMAQLNRYLTSNYIPGLEPN